MTNKEFIICCLALDEETMINIQGFFELDEKEITTEEIKKFIDDLIRDEIVCVTGERECICSRKKSVMMTTYGLTHKGKDFYNQISETI